MQGSKVVPLSYDHKPINKEEKDRIVNAQHFVQIERVDGTLAVSRAIGDHQFKNRNNIPWNLQAVTANPDILTFDRTNEDLFIINACDGIWDCLSNKEACMKVKEYKKTLKIGEPESQISHQILDDILAPEVDNDALGTDNMTCIVSYFKQ